MHRSLVMAELSATSSFLLARQLNLLQNFFKIFLVARIFQMEKEKITVKNTLMKIR
jgi:hypothetical protein